ncbi:calcium/proton exchanger [Klebsiella pneumoniae]|nr:calcium/proton exchanger [Klebsiella pneumoniae]
MTHAHEAVKTRHKESSLVFPVLALAVLFFWAAASHCQWLSRSISSHWSAF